MIRVSRLCRLVYFCACQCGNFVLNGERECVRACGPVCMRLCELQPVCGMPLGETFIIKQNGRVESFYLFIFVFVSFSRRSCSSCGRAQHSNDCNSPRYHAIRTALRHTTTHVLSKHYLCTRRGCLAQHSLAAVSPLRKPKHSKEATMRFPHLITWHMALLFAGPKQTSFFIFFRMYVSQSDVK